MPNMSYCRFRNTLGDLKDCYNNMEEEDVDYEEENARERLIKLCIDIANEFGFVVNKEVEVNES